MHAGRVYTIREVFVWTWRETVVFFVIAAVPTALHELAGWDWMSLPWLPVALIGTAVAFIIGFKNNASYDRLWEARKIWGGIVNDSRTWTINVLGLVQRPEEPGSIPSVHMSAVHKRLVYRHLAWLHALRHQLRQPRVWEAMQGHDKGQTNYRRWFRIPELEDDIHDVLAPYLDPSELESVLATANPAAQILAAQAQDLQRLKGAGALSDYRHVELQRTLSAFFDHQGKCERIKNFPYPRQFATINLYFVWIFIILTPLGMLEEFGSYGKNMVWLTIPFSALVAWVFHTMEKIGSSTENPFEGGANDVPMAALTRTIEIDLRQMLKESNVPIPLTPENHILM